MTRIRSAKPIHIIAISGSLRKGSFNLRLLEAAQMACPARMSITINDDLRNLPLFDEDLEDEMGNGPEVVVRFKNLVAQADGLIIATPEYSNSIPGGLKNALDWLSRGDTSPLEEMPTAIVGATTGGWGTRLSQAALRQVLYSTGSLVMPDSSNFVRQAASSFDQSGALTDERLKKSLAEMVENLGQWIARVRPNGASK
jgi:chromate reductase